MPRRYLQGWGLSRAFPSTPARGTLFAPDGNTVSHVYWRGGAIVDALGNSWTMNGTVPQVSASGSVPPGAGPYSDANYYSLGSGSDVLDFAGDFTICLAFRPDTASANDVFVSNGTAAIAGWSVQSNASSQARVNNYRSGATDSSATSNTIQASTPNVLCAGRSGSNLLVKLNSGSTATAACGTITTGSAYAAQIGRYNGGGSLNPDGSILEVLLTSSTPSDAVFSAFISAAFAKMGLPVP